MDTLADKILKVITNKPGITDRWLAEAIFGPGAHQQRVNPECRHLDNLGRIKRTKRNDGLIGNYPAQTNLSPQKEKNIVLTDPVALNGTAPPNLGLSEDALKEALETWLSRSGWTTKIAWGRAQGIDIAAERDNKRWIIEAKGNGSLPAMRVNYFLCALGELLQRMDDPNANYSIALPDMQQYRNLWARLPRLAKDRTSISAIFVTENGVVEIVH